MPKTSTSYQELIQKIIHEYQKERGSQPYQMHEVVDWALRTGRIDPPQRDIVRMLAREFSRAARNDYFTDEQGRTVRRNHPRRVSVPGELQQQVFWDDILTALPEHMRMSFQQRRKGILYDCVQLRTDSESYNDNNKYKVQLLPLDFNFNLDLEEMQQSTEYPEVPQEADADNDE